MTGDMSYSDVALNPQGDASRCQLVTMLNGLSIPDDFRVVLSYDNDVNRIKLNVEQYDPGVVLRLGKVNVPLFGRSWKVVRSLVSTTYSSMIHELRDHPEFLEFRVVICNELHAAVV